MIEVLENRFFLQTNKTLYVFEVSKHKHLNHLYYGPLIEKNDVEACRIKHNIMLGGNVLIDQKDSTYNLDNLLLEFSTSGKGDYREPSLEFFDQENNFNSDYQYKSYTLLDDKPKIQTLVSSRDHESATHLKIILEDKMLKQEVHLYYSCYEKFDIITRRVEVFNLSNQVIKLKKCMSFTLDIPNRDYTIYNLSGTWSKETHLQKRKVSDGSFVNMSTTGTSSHFFNPGVLLSSSDQEDTGISIGSNIIYSGNHYSSISKNYHNLCRLQVGINPLNFLIELNPLESFETPEAVLTLSSEGNNGISHNFHQFINECIVRQPNLLKPIVFNHWESTFFNYNEKKLLSLAKKASQVGMEIFVIDDGWFSNRNDDTQGLGDYHINHRKFPKGLKHFVDKIHQLKMKCGIWVEPEMVNQDSQLYKKHPEWIVKTPYSDSATGRNQYVLDITNPKVQQYIVENVNRLIDENQFDYIKWDMNRHISDAYGATLKNQGSFYHEYVMSLYMILHQIFDHREQVILEMCSSGGNRFDLGMLCFASQIWSSDNTDPIERLKIQEGLSYFYPLSSISNHVSMSPHASTLRMTPLSTRFNVSAFGCFGYELDLDQLTSIELKEMKDQVQFYKEHRKIFQYGDFKRFNLLKENKVQWQVSHQDNHIIGYFQLMSETVESFDQIKTSYINPKSHYHFKTKAQRLMIDRFKQYVEHVFPLKLKPDGFILTQAEKYIALWNGTQEYHISGKALQNGIMLNQQFMASGYHPDLRILSDFGSQLYIITKEKEDE